MTNVASSLIPVQEFAINFNNPVSVSSQVAQAAVLNGMLNILCPVGTVIPALCTEPQFQANIGNPSPATWILADGRDVTGSAYASLFGSDNVVDLTGQFMRGKNNGRSDGFQNPSGDLALGTFTADNNGGHVHTIGAHEQTLQNSGNARFSTHFDNGSAFNYSAQTQGAGGNENAPKNVTVSHFIRIN